MEGELVIRPARTSDRSDMEQVCARTFEWGDCIPDVWEAWLSDEKGPVVVGELGGRVVALSKITFQTAEQVWLEGMRVDPEHRRDGIARQFLDDGIDHASPHGPRVVRLGWDCELRLLKRGMS